jgi:hypothetical protein
MYLFIIYSCILHLSIYFCGAEDGTQDLTSALPLGHIPNPEESIKYTKPFTQFNFI